MLKRRPGTELNHDNWDNEEEPEEKGKFRTASEEELKNRVIKTARRRGPADKPASSSVFGGFSGFTATTAASSAEKPASSIFAFLSQDKKADDAPQPATATPSEAKDKEYHQKLRALNQSVSEWIKQHVDENPICILTPIFHDYAKYLKELDALRDKSPSNGVGSGIAAAAVAATKPASSDNAAAVKETTTFKGFSFGSASPAVPAASTTPKSSDSTLSNFSSVPKISFGSTSSTGSLFGGVAKSPESSTPVVPPSTGFSFGAAKPFSFGSAISGPVAAAAKETAAKNDDAEAENDDDEPPKVEFTPVVEEDSVYSKRCKVFFKIDGNFQERGIGTLFVKPVKDSAKHQMIVRADTSLGNILVNLVLAQGLPIKKMGSNNVMLVCIPNTDFDKPVSVLLKVKAAADADEVIEKLESYTAA